MASIKKYKSPQGEFWSLRGFVGYREDGREIRVNRRGFKTKKEAQDVMKKLVEEYESNHEMVLTAPQITFQELYDLWLIQYRLQVKPSSIATARRYCELHILPKFGKLKLDRITVAYCQSVVNEWHRKYKQYNYLKKETQKIMAFGVLMGSLATNPMKQVQVPRRKEVEEPIKFYTKEELKGFLTHCQTACSPKLYTFFRLLSFTGARKSEILSLTWGDVDFNSRLLSIGKTLTIDEHGDKIIQSPKTKNSIRFLNLDTVTLQVLKEWQQTQKDELSHLSTYTESKKQLIFSNKSNELYYPQVANDWLTWVYLKYTRLDINSKKRLLKEVGTLEKELETRELSQETQLAHEAKIQVLEQKRAIEHTPMKRITVHGFRYTHCSLLFEANASIKEVQARLGHKDVQTTMNIYACVTPKMIENTGEKFASYINF